MNTKLAEDSAEAGGERSPMRGDLTEGPVVRTLLVFAVPALVANMLQTLGQTINTIWVGQLIGEAGLAATLNANMVVFLAFAVVFGFGSATSIKVGQNFGARNVDGARRSVGTGIGFCTVLAMIGSVLGWWLAQPLLRVLSTPPAVHDMALAYMRVSFVSLPFMTVSMIVSMGLRAVGDARTPLYAMIVTTLTGALLNPVLILGMGPFPELGIAGSALANAIGAFAGVVLMIFWTYRKDLSLRLRGRELGYLRPGGEDLRFILAKGLPMGAQMLVSSAASLIVIGLVNREGMMTAAAFGAIMQIWNYIQMPAFGISMAVSAMVAQSIGAGKHDRVGRVTIAGVAVNSVITVALSALLIAFDRPLFELFLGAGSSAVPIAEHIQMITVMSWVLIGVMMVVSGTLRSYGVVVVPLLIMIVSQYFARFGFYFVAYPIMGVEALWWCFNFGSVVSLILIVFTYTRGRWRKRELPSAAAVPAE